jgi:hypothetical protein
MRATWFAAALAVALAASACGKSEEQKQTEAAAQQVKEAAEKFDKAAREAAGKADADGAEMAKGLEAMAQGLAGAASAMGGDGKTVDPIGFKELQPFFPDLPGWEKGKPTGERMTSPVPFSQAEVHYRKGNSRIEMSIVDSGLHPLLLAPYTMLLATGYEKQTENGYEKSTKVGSDPGWEKWNGNTKRGEVSAVVAQRFVVRAEGTRVEDLTVLKDALAKTDLARLAALQ